jgi:large subunit ribosomal protein L6e
MTGEKAEKSDTKEKKHKAKKPAGNGKVQKSTPKAKRSKKRKPHYS